MKSETNLPVQESYRPAPIVLDADYEPQVAHVPLAHYLWILRRHAWKIAGGVAATVLATLIVSLRLTPIYESTVTIDIDRRMPTNVLGQEAAEVANNDADQFLATQVKLIQSDSVLRPVVDKYPAPHVEKDALEEAVDKSADQSGSAGDPEAPADRRGRPTLTSCKSATAPPTANWPPMSPMRSRYPTWPTPIASATKPPPA